MVRTASPDDAESILTIYTPYVTQTAVSFEERPPAIEEMRERIRKSHVWLVAEEDSRINAYAYAARFHPRDAYRWSVEVSIYVVEDAQGRGLGKLLLAALLERLRELGFVNVFAGTTLPNAGSVTLFESFGFEKIAHQRKVGYKLGSWHDVGWWQLHLRDAPNPPPPLRPSVK